jgi:hypothetical protein
MTKLVAVSKSTHSQKVWRRPANYQFAATESLAQIVLAEVVQVASWMPIVFVQQKEDRYAAVAMMSPMQRHNLFVGPDGQWLGGYVPASLRSYPFRLLRREGSEQMALCIDEDSGLVKEGDEQGENFFTANGEPSQVLSQLMETLRRVEGSRVATELAMASLAEAGVIEQWPLQVQVGDKKSGINDLYRINESALAALDDEVFLKLRKTGALRLAYAQVMSMGQIARFDQLMRLRQQLAQQPKIRPPEEIFKMEPTDLIRFD